MNPDKQDIISKKALGRVAFLGSLYDVRTDSFSGTNLFKTSIPESCISSADSPTTDYLHQYEETYSSKFDKLNIDAELQLSLLAGMLKLEGSGKYLSDDKKSAKSTKCSLIYKNRRVTQEINLFDDNLRNLISSDALESVNATHVVCGIEWGASVVVSLEYNNEKSKDSREIAGSFQGLFDKLSCSIKGKSDIELDNNEKELKTKLTIKVCGDITMKDSSPNSVESALELMKNVQLLIDGTNGAKGVQLDYVLFPLKNLNFIELKSDPILRKITSSTITRVKQKFDQLLSEKQKMNDTVEEIYSNEAYLTRELVDSLRNRVADLEVQECQFRDQLGELLVQVRSGKEEINKIDLFLASDSASNDNIFNKINDLLDFAKTCKTKCKLESISKFNKKNMFYLSRYDEVNELEMNHSNNDVYIFYNLMSETTKNERKLNETLFLALYDKNPNEFYYVINCDLFAELKSETKPRIAWYSKTKLNSDDLYHSNNDEVNQDALIMNGTSIMVAKRTVQCYLDFNPIALLLGNKDEKSAFLTQICASNSKDSLAKMSLKTSFFGKKNFNILYGEDSKTADECLEQLEELCFKAVLFLVKYESRHDQMLKKFYNFAFNNDLFDKISVLLVSNWDEAKEPEKEFKKILETFNEIKFNNIVFFSRRSDVNSLSNLIYSCIANIYKNN